MRTLAQFIGVLLLVGFIGAYFWWIIAIAAGVLVVCVIYYSPSVVANPPTLLGAYCVETAKAR